MDPKAELRDFLRQRCGNLKAAFAALDGSETGQLNRHDFETGLCRMGWHDCGNTFLDFDRDNTGTVNLRAFVNGLLGDDVVFGASSRPARHTYHPGMNTPRKLSEHLAPTLLQRIAPQPVVALPHSQPLTPKRCDKEHFARVTPLASSTSPKRSNGPAGAPLEERVRQLENQLAAEQEARCNLEWRLTSQFREMIREEFQGLRRHLAEDAVPNQRVPIYSHLVEKFPRAKDADDEERHYVMVASVSERRLEVEGDTASSVQSRAQHAPDGHDRHDPPPSGHAHGRAVSGTVNGHAHCAGCQQKELPKLDLTPRTLLRQENLALREQILTLREQAIDAKEKESAAAVTAVPSRQLVMTRSQSDQKEVKDMHKGALRDPCREAAPAAARHSGATAWVPAQSLRSSLGRSSTGGTYRMPQRYMNR
ncbi:Uncharacterized protein SCF082_LOCUS38070 [Durusdinium trenchii]|uniref:EF-hand domain-containing protein n=1 Tax=Durusdinium trenchii TaxID=1381693 RepID=A0ABP0PWK6_9DINO